jgi:hypothetical protein
MTRRLRENDPRFESSLRSSQIRARNVKAIHLEWNNEWALLFTETHVLRYKYLDVEPGCGEVGDDRVSCNDGNM